jgi:hypothetical protein
VANDKKKSVEELAEEFAAITLEHLEKLSPEESEKRIVALEKRVATISVQKKKAASDSTMTSGGRTRPIPAYCRDRERN